ncbi:unnamed protein product, partial [Staurois parvus]
VQSCVEYGFGGKGREKIGGKYEGQPGRGARRRGEGAAVCDGGKTVTGNVPGCVTGILCQYGVSVFRHNPCVRTLGAKSWLVAGVFLRRIGPPT